MTKAELQAQGYVCEPCKVNLTPLEYEKHTGIKVKQGDTPPLLGVFVIRGPGGYPPGWVWNRDFPFPQSEEAAWELAERLSQVG